MHSVLDHPGNNVIRESVANLASIVKDKPNADLLVHLKEFMTLATVDHSLTTYRLEVELDQVTKDKVAVVLYAAEQDNGRTGLMNTNKLCDYVGEHNLAMDSTDPLILKQEEAGSLIFAVLRDWNDWQTFLTYDMAGQDIG